jgi:hypothetical protein
MRQAKNMKGSEPMKKRMLVQFMAKHATNGTYINEHVKLLTTPETLEADLRTFLAAQYPSYSLEMHREEPRRLLIRYRRLSGHLICASLGYLTPRAAEAMLEQYKAGKGYYCEWIYDMQLKTGRDMFDLTKDTIQHAIRIRKHNHGYMADIDHAYATINRELAGSGPIFASWF